MAVAIVAGALANKPFNGGEAWVRLSWALGLRRLGFDVHFVEQLSSGDDDSRRWFEHVTREFDLDGQATLLCGGEETAPERTRLAEVAARAELLVNLSGHLTLSELLRGPRVRLYVDLDPGFTQSWHADPAVDFELAGHDHYATVGLAIGRPWCRIPTSGIDWIPTLPPVLLDRFPAQPMPSAPLRFTTIATWRSPSGSVVIDGEAMSLKHHQFRRMIELPRRVPHAVFEIALAIHPGDAADLEALREHGWRIVEPRAVADEPLAFRDYVAGSAAEFSVAQGAYVDSRSGWFSDRTAAYLASGRPALVQDTGLDEDLLPDGGLLTFGSLDDAVAGAEAIVADPAGHGAAARAFAEERLDSDLVLGRLLERIGVQG
jgi:hypothetical protein